MRSADRLPMMHVRPPPFLWRGHFLELMKSGMRRRRSAQLALSKQNQPPAHTDTHTRSVTHTHTHTHTRSVTHTHTHTVSHHNSLQLYECILSAGENTLYALSTSLSEVSLPKSAVVYIFVRSLGLTKKTAKVFFVLSLWFFLLNCFFF